MVVLVAEATFVSEDGAVYVEAGRLSVLFGHICVLLEKMHLGFSVEVRLDGCLIVRKEKLLAVFLLSNQTEEIK